MLYLPNAITNAVPGITQNARTKKEIKNLNFYVQWHGLVRECCGRVWKL